MRKLPSCLSTPHGHRATASWRKPVDTSRDCLGGSLYMGQSATLRRKRALRTFCTSLRKHDQRWMACQRANSVSLFKPDSIAMRIDSIAKYQEDRQADSLRRPRDPFIHRLGYLHSARVQAKSQDADVTMRLADMQSMVAQLDNWSSQHALVPSVPNNTLKHRRG